MAKESFQQRVKLSWGGQTSNNINWLSALAPAFAKQHQLNRISLSSVFFIDVIPNSNLDLAKLKLHQLNFIIDLDELKKLISLLDIIFL